MSTSYNRKKKKKSPKKSLNPKILLVAAFILVFVVACIFIIIASANKKDYYECTEYIFVTTTDADPIEDNYLEEFDYYRIYLEKNNKFTLRFKKKLSEPGKVSQEEIYLGTYTKTNTRLILTYTSFREEMYGEDDEKGVVKYNIVDGKLIREQFVSIGEVRMTIKQTFKEK